MRRQRAGHDKASGRFQSTHPLRGATHVGLVTGATAAFQSTHPLRGATSPSLPSGGKGKNFNPRTPCGVRRQPRPRPQPSSRFQSTHPLRGATNFASIPSTAFYFNPRTPCGVRPGRARQPEVTAYFNPRTPCGVRRSMARILVIKRHFNPRTPCGVRHLSLDVLPSAARFQSTHPLRGATEDRALAVTLSIISIHAPLAGCD